MRNTPRADLPGSGQRTVWVAQVGGHPRVLLLKVGLKGTPPRMASGLSVASSGLKDFHLGQAVYTWLDSRKLAEDRIGVA